MNTKKYIKIAIDGPAGSGKSSVCKVISEKLGIKHVDSGAIYRTITKIILDSNLKISLYDDIEKLLKNLNIVLKDEEIYINGTAYKNDIRSREVNELVSPVSSLICVREKVNSVLNEYSKSVPVIMDGRDITTVVFKDADYKFYLDASVEVRAERRLKETSGDSNYDSIYKNIADRDHNDKTKAFGALKIADDAVYIDTTELSFNEVVDKILSYIKF